VQDRPQLSSARFCEERGGTWWRGRGWSLKSFSITAKQGALSGSVKLSTTATSVSVRSSAPASANPP